MIIDGHVHLDAIERVDETLRRARSAGVHRLVAVGMDLESNRKTLELARRYPGVVSPAIGYHPWNIRAGEIEAAIDFIRRNLASCVALGEVGLDYKVKVKKPLQQDVFSKAIRLAQDNRKPVIVHSRFSYERTFQMISAAGVEKAVFHWYSGPLDILEKIVAAGYYVSATPALAYSRFHQAAMKKAPLEKIMVETDSPVAYQGETSEPAHLLRTLAALSRIKKVPVDRLSRITAETAARFFNLAGLPHAELPPDV